MPAAPSDTLVAARIPQTLAGPFAPALMRLGSVLAKRRFDMEDQTRFGHASGDRNPIHVDPVAARRTLAGTPVVHGTHLLLWAVDQLARLEPALPDLGALQARFDRFVLVRETVELVLRDRTDARIMLDLRVGHVTVSGLSLTFGTPVAAAPVAAKAPVVEPPELALGLTLAQMRDSTGRLRFVSPGLLTALFPAAAAWLGSPRVAALGAMTALVGMVCPGLHSVFGRIRVQACDDHAHAPGLLQFRAFTDERLRAVRLAVVGGGFAGMLDSLARPPPTQQAGVAALAALVRPGEFAGSRALVVGGSRGLGELTAKLLAAGGSDVTVTYRIGRGDAERVAGEIRAAGFRCDTCAYDALEPAGPQLAVLAEAPTHGYYFATPAIAGRRKPLLDRTALLDFIGIYVNGFQGFGQALQARRRDVTLFYPSTVFIDDRPDQMLEYAMSKASGELLCDEMNRTMAPMRVVCQRLPRLPTDQTGGAGDLGQAALVMLGAARAVHHGVGPLA